MVLRVLTTLMLGKARWICSPNESVLTMLSDGGMPCEKSSSLAMSIKHLAVEVSRTSQAERLQRGRVVRRVDDDRAEGSGVGKGAEADPRVLLLPDVEGWIAVDVGFGAGQGLGHIAGADGHVVAKLDQAGADRPADAARAEDTELHGLPPVRSLWYTTRQTCLSSGRYYRDRSVSCQGQLTGEGTMVDDPRSARQKILAVASERFYREGFRAVGIDTIIAEAGVGCYRDTCSSEEIVKLAEAQDRRDASAAGQGKRLRGRTPGRGPGQVAIGNAATKPGSSPGCARAADSRSLTDCGLGPHPTTAIDRQPLERSTSRARQLTISPTREIGSPPAKCETAWASRFGNPSVSGRCE